MKKTLVSLLLMILVATACAPQTPTEPPSIISYPNYPNYPSRPTPSKSTPTPIHVDLTPAQRAAITALSETLSLPADQITLISTEAVTWPDGCMGIVRMGVMCTQAEVPGFKIVLEANSEKYEYHTNQDGSIASLAAGAQSSAAVENAVIKQLAGNLGLKESDVSVVSDMVIEFGDSCLGVSMEDMMCAQVVTPGHVIVLEANGVQYEYHTSALGDRIQPTTLALTWKREGGIAGFCDSLTVFLSGEVYGNQCKTDDGRMETFASLFTASEQKQFAVWIAKYGQVDLDASDPKGVADGMTVLLTLYGNGNSQPAKDDEAAIFLWVQNLYQKLYK